jgi:hypothetical protein
MPTGRMADSLWESNRRFTARYTGQSPESTVVPLPSASSGFYTLEVNQPRAAHDLKANWEEKLDGESIVRNVNRISTRRFVRGDFCYPPRAPYRLFTGAMNC